MTGVTVFLDGQPVNTLFISDHDIVEPDREFDQYVADNFWELV